MLTLTITLTLTLTLILTLTLLLTLTNPNPNTNLKLLQCISHAGQTGPVNYTLAHFAKTASIERCVCVVIIPSLHDTTGCETG